MKRKYDSCYFCGGQVAEKHVTVDYRWGGDLLAILKNVPAGVCQTCGEQYFKADVVKAMERSANSRRKAVETVEVPVRTMKVA